jgi:hypothetical protein
VGSHGFGVLREEQEKIVHCSIRIERGQRFNYSFFANCAGCAARFTIDETETVPGRRIGKNSGRIIDTLTDGSMAE